MRVFPCSAKKTDLFGKVKNNIPAEMKFSKCEKCGEISCLLTDGMDSTPMDAGFQARKIMKQLPHLANDSFMQEVATL